MPRVVAITHQRNVHRDRPGGAASAAGLEGQRATWPADSGRDTGWAKAHCVEGNGAQFQGAHTAAQCARSDASPCDATLTSSAVVRRHAQVVVFYSFLFVVPSLVTFFLYTKGKTQATREEILNSESYKARMREKFGEESEIRMAEIKAEMNKVLFETKGTLGKPDWAIKRDEERARRAAEGKSNCSIM